MALDRGTGIDFEFTRIFEFDSAVSGRERLTDRFERTVFEMTECNKILIPTDRSN